MLLTGQFRRSLDEKMRFSVPKPLREELGNPRQTVLYFAPGTDGSLALYPEDTLTLLGNKLAANSPVGNNVRDFSRLFYAQAVRVEMDSQGRLRIPSELASLGSLSKEIVLLGVRDYLEVWDAVGWDAYLAVKQPHYDEISEQAFDVTAANVTTMEAESQTPAKPK